MLAWLRLTCEGAVLGAEIGRDEMKYMIMTFGDTSGLEGKSPEWIKEMIEFMRRIDVELTESGELVFQQGLADASQARTVRVQQGIPVATDGPFAESRESLAGFWVVDVENEARAVEIAARISQAADAPIEVRQCMDAWRALAERMGGVPSRRFPQWASTR
jgi:hypothetical protein